MKRRTLFYFIIIISLFLTSCGQRAPGDSPISTEQAVEEVQIGTEGVEISLLPNYPPNLLYDENELIAILDVKNKGNHELQPQDCFVQITGFDSNIIRGDFGRATSCAQNIGTLEGKTVFNLEGGSNQIEFRSTSLSLPRDVFEYEPNLNILACYNYITTANPSVCVDPLFYQITSDQKACTPKDVSMGGGQGGPVGVSYVGVDMIGERAVFEINVVKYGSGRVLSPDVNLQDCGSSAIDFADLDKVRYTATLSSSGIADCKPRDGYVRLVNGQGKVVCSFDIRETTAFETLLQVELDYAYLESINQKVKIISTPE